MRYISYRSKLRLRAALIGLAIALVLLAAAAVGVFIYLHRYIVYTPDGARLDLDGGLRSALETDFDVEASKSAPAPVPGATLAEGSELEEPAKTLEQINGWYADGAMLAAPSRIREAVSGLTEPAAVCVDVRSIYGNFYYSSAIAGAQTSSSVDPPAVDDLLRDLASTPEVYLIAWLPAFRDSSWALAELDCALSLRSGALWMDSEGCYWLDPSDDQVIARLESIIQELESLGFDEVVLSDFAFPDDPAIVFEGDRSQALLDAAQKLRENLDQSEDIKLSFSTRDSALAPYADRFYYRDLDGAEIPALTDALEGAFPDLHNCLVFLTDSRDTRFESFGRLKPAYGSSE